MTAKKQPKKQENKVNRFKDLEVGKEFQYNGSKCLCEVQEDGHTIFNNIVENKRYKTKNDRVVT